MFQIMNCAAFALYASYLIYVVNNNFIYILRLRSTYIGTTYLPLNGIKRQKRFYLVFILLVVTLINFFSEQCKTAKSQFSNPMASQFLIKSVAQVLSGVY